MSDPSADQARIYEERAEEYDALIRAERWSCVPECTALFATRT